MGDVHIPKPDPSRGQIIGARVQELIDSGHEFYQTVVTGAPGGRVRRPTLFVIAAVGAAIGTQFWIGAIVSIIAILLLALSDSVVEL